MNVVKAVIALFRMYATEHELALPLLTSPVLLNSAVHVQEGSARHRCCVLPRRQGIEEGHWHGDVVLTVAAREAIDLGRHQRDESGHRDRVQTPLWNEVHARDISSNPDREDQGARRGRTPTTRRIRKCDSLIANFHII